MFPKTIMRTPQKASHDSRQCQCLMNAESLCGASAFEAELIQSEFAIQDLVSPNSHRAAWVAGGDPVACPSSTSPGRLGTSMDELVLDAPRLTEAGSESIMNQVHCDWSDNSQQPHPTIPSPAGKIGAESVQATGLVVERDHLKR